MDQREAALRFVFVLGVRANHVPCCLAEVVSQEGAARSWVSSGRAQQQRGVQDHLGKLLTGEHHKLGWHSGWREQEDVLQQFCCGCRDAEQHSTETSRSALGMGCHAPAGTCWALLEQELC